MGSPSAPQPPKARKALKLEQARAATCFGGVLVVFRMLLVRFGCVARVFRERSLNRPAAQSSSAGPEMTEVSATVLTMGQIQILAPVAGLLPVILPGRPDRCCSNSKTTLNSLF